MVRWASEPVEKSKSPGFDGLGGPSYRLFPNDSQPLSSAEFLRAGHFLSFGCGSTYSGGIAFSKFGRLRPVAEGVRFT